MWLPDRPSPSNHPSSAVVSSICHFRPYSPLRRSSWARSDRRACWAGGPSFGRTSGAQFSADRACFLLQLLGQKRPASVHGGRSYFRGPALGPLVGASRFRLMRAAAAAGSLSLDGALHAKRP